MKKIEFFECLEEMATKRNLVFGEDIGKYWDFLKDKNFLKEAMKSISEKNFYKDFSKNVFRLPTIIEIEAEIKKFNSDDLIAKKFQNEKKDIVSNEEAALIMNRFSFHRDLIMNFKMPIKKAMGISPMKNYVARKKIAPDPTILMTDYFKKIEVSFSS